MNKSQWKAWQAEIAVEFLLDQLHSPEIAGNPAKLTSCLYVLKTYFEKSPMPRVAEMCFQRNILGTLTDLLRTEFNPRDKSNEVQSLFYFALFGLFSSPVFFCFQSLTLA